MNSRSPIAPLRQTRSETTLALLATKQQKIEIGLRIKELREGSAETNRSIADYCDVSVEAVRNWIAGKGMAYENAEKVAGLFGVDVGWLWRGSEPAPGKDFLGPLSGGASDPPQNEEELQRLLEGQHELLEGQAELRRLLEDVRKMLEGGESGQESGNN